MNILFFYRIYPEYGGVEVVTTVLANCFVKDGNKVIIASIEQPHLELKDKLDSNIQLVKLDYPVISKKNISKLHSVITECNIDIIINQWGLPFMATILCNKARKGTSCKLISVLHGSPYTSKRLLNSRKNYTASNLFTKPINFVKYKFMDRLIRWSIHYNVTHSEKYVLLSKGFIQPLITYAHLKVFSNIVAISNPITINIKKERIDVDNKKKQLLYVGRMDLVNKNVNRIIEVWKTLWEKHTDWQLLLVGDGPDKQKLVDYVKEHKIGHVNFVGFKKEPPLKYYEDASIFLLTSDLEGFGLVVIESMAYGAVPVVYGSYEAIFDIIQNGKSGFITHQPFSHKEFSDKIEFLMNNDERRKEMANEAISRAKLFNVNATVQRWYNLFNDILD